MGKQKQKKKTTSMFTGFNYNTAVKESQKKAAAAKKIADAKKLADKKASDNKKAKEDANKLTRTYGGTSAVSGKTETKVESKAKSNFNYNTELAKKQKPDLIRTERITADKKAADKKAADKKKAADAKTKNGKEVKTVVESLIRPKTPVSSNSGGKGGGTETPVVVKTPAKTVSQIWKEKTGTEWSEAKKQGLSDGSSKSNLALLEKLKSGSLDKNKQSPTKMETVKATDMKISYNGPTKLAGVGDEPIDNELIDKPGYGAKKKLGGIMRKGGQVRKKRKK